MRRAYDFVFASQYPSGGWPQRWPLQGRGDYKDAVTFNDDVHYNLMVLLAEVVRGTGTFRGLTDSRAAAAHARGLQLILDAQIVVGGQRTVW